jgi:hypothetical protein
MYKLISASLVFVLLSINAYANPILSEEKARAVSAEIAQAARDRDFSVIEKYMHPSSSITIDLDPAPSSGETEISYDEYMQMTRQSWSMVNNVEISVEELSVSVDRENNQATIKERSVVVYEMMGMKIKDVSVGETTYGVVDGQIKILKVADQLISSGPVE